jgi:anti-anti-sigma factor
MKIKLETHKSIRVIHLKGESYISTAAELRKVLQNELEVSSFVNYVLDLAEVEYFTSDEIGVIVEFQKRISDRDGKLRVCAIGKALLELLRILRLDTILKIDETLEDSLAALETTG